MKDALYGIMTHIAINDQKLAPYICRYNPDKCNTSFEKLKNQKTTQTRPPSHMFSQLVAKVFPKLGYLESV